MKFITNKNVKRKILIAILIIIIASFIFPVKAQASIGGKLLQPVIDLVVALSDGAYGMVHRFVLDQSVTLLRIDLDDSVWEIIGSVLAGILGALLVLGIGFLTGGLGYALAAGGLTAILAVGGTVVAATAGGLLAGTVFNSVFFGDEVVLPMYALSPENIFSGETGMFNVDFFNPTIILDDKYMVKTTEGKLIDSREKTNNISNVTAYLDDLKSSKEYILEKYPAYSSIDDKDEFLEGYMYSSPKMAPGTKSTIMYSKLDASIFSKNNLSPIQFVQMFKNINYKDISQKEFELIQSMQPVKVKTILEKNTEDGTYSYKVEIYELTIEKVKTEIHGIAYELKDIIASWYVSIRNIVIVGMMSVLVYIGIRILISSTSNDKAKYKQFLIDWIVAICLVFVMHYIMAFSNTIVNKIIKVINSTAGDTYYTLVVADKDEKVSKYLKEEVGYAEEDIEYYEDAR